MSGYRGTWEELGATDPYFAVLTEDRYRSARLDANALDTFFASGRDHAARVLTVARSLEPGFTPRRALDFGCGVGRVAIPFAAACEHVVGTDASPAMLERARLHADEAGVTNLELVRTGDTLAELPGSFDFIHSFAVLQHIPVGTGMALLRHLLSRLSDGGIAALHLTYARHSRRAPLLRWARANITLLHRAANLLTGRPWREPYMQMNCYDLNAVLAAFRAAGCGRLALRFTTHGDAEGVFIFGQRRREEEV